MRVVEQPSNRAVAGVFDNLSTVTRDELAIVGFDGNRARSYFTGTRDTADVYALLDGDEPIALFWYPATERDPATYFLATEAYFDRYIAATRATRGFLAAHSRRDLVVNCLSPHPMAARWLKAIGFAVEDWTSGTRKFRMS